MNYLLELVENNMLGGRSKLTSCLLGIGGTETIFQLLCVARGKARVKISQNLFDVIFDRLLAAHEYQRTLNSSTLYYFDICWKYNSNIVKNITNILYSACN